MKKKKRNEENIIVYVIVSFLTIAIALLTIYIAIAGSIDFIMALVAKVPFFDALYLWFINFKQPILIDVGLAALEIFLFMIFGFITDEDLEDKHKK